MTEPDPLPTESGPVIKLSFQPSPQYMYAINYDISYIYIYIYKEWVPCSRMMHTQIYIDVYIYIYVHIYKSLSIYISGCYLQFMSSGITLLQPAKPNRLKSCTQYSSDTAVSKVFKWLARFDYSYGESVSRRSDWLDWICLTTTHVLQDILAVLHKYTSKCVSDVLSFAK